MVLKFLRIAAPVALGVLLSGCNFVVLDPSGDVALQQRNLVVISTVLMLLIIVPVMALTALFAWRYRQSNTAAPYDPDWDHSTQLELVIWSAPLLIIICLGALTWMGTHLLDPYRALGRIASGQPVLRSVKPLEVDVVALDWKWLFIYPEYGFATVNELAAPVGRPVDFHITSATVMNSFYIPALAGQIYAMAGMQTQLNLVASEPGSYRGRNTQYSGDGFADQHFEAVAMTEDDFNAWVETAKADGKALDAAAYEELAKPSSKVPVTYYSSVEPDLYQSIIQKYDSGMAAMTRAGMAAEEQASGGE